MQGELNVGNIMCMMFYLVSSPLFLCAVCVCTMIV